MEHSFDANKIFRNFCIDYFNESDEGSHCTVQVKFKKRELKISKLKVNFLKESKTAKLSIHLNINLQ